MLLFFIIVGFIFLCIYSAYLLDNNKNYRLISPRVPKIPMMNDVDLKAFDKDFSNKIEIINFSFNESDITFDILFKETSKIEKCRYLFNDGNILIRENIYLSNIFSAHEMNYIKNVLYEFIQDHRKTERDKIRKELGMDHE